MGVGWESVGVGLGFGLGGDNLRLRLCWVYNGMRGR